MDYETLVRKTAERSDTSKAKVAEVFTAFREVVIEALGKDDNVKFTRLGTFKMIKYKETHRRDPKTRIIAAIPARVKPGFTFSQMADDTLTRRG